jgi:hypothetical protein
MSEDREEDGHDDLRDLRKHLPDVEDRDNARSSSSHARRSACSPLEREGVLRLVVVRVPMASAT